MKTMLWKDKYNLGIPVIDEHHRKLLDLINDLLLAQKSKADKELINKILHSLSDYTIYHFSFEEDWFDRVNFENKEQHKKEHRSFILRLENFHADFQISPNLPDDLIQNMILWLQNWLTEHIMEKDREYVTLLAT